MVSAPPTFVPTLSGRCLRAARPSGLVSSGKALGGNREGVGSCGGQTDSNPLTALAAMGPRLLLPLLLLWTRGTQGSELDPNGRHVCGANRWILWESDGGGGGTGVEAWGEEEVREEVMGLKGEKLGKRSLGCGG